MGGKDLSIGGGDVGWIRYYLGQMSWLTPRLEAALSMAGGFLRRLRKEGSSKVRYWNKDEKE